MADKAIHCPVEAILTVIGGKWKVLIIWHLRESALRFGELKRQMPTSITQQMLTQQLRELEADGVVHREIFAQVPPRVEYSLTEFGRSLQPVLHAMSQWGEAFLQRRLL
jgi:DNA-binding HxlR family transcriptional regulator